MSLVITLNQSKDDSNPCFIDEDIDQRATAHCFDSPACNDNPSCEGCPLFKG
jgi:hypothetical protein